jgi:hypothetical protein
MEKGSSYFVMGAELGAHVVERAWAEEGRACALACPAEQRAGEARKAEVGKDHTAKVAEAVEQTVRPLVAVLEVGSALWLIPLSRKQKL